MRRLIAGLMASALVLSGVSAFACPGEKDHQPKDGKGEMGTPSKPKS